MVDIMKKYIIAIISIMAFITSGCQKAVLETKGELSEIKVTASLPVMTRVAMNAEEHVTKTSWEEGDVICIMVEDEAYYYTAVSINGSQATFEPLNEDNILKATENDSIQAYYGCLAGETGQWSSYRSAVPLSATGTITGNKLSLKFSHMLSYILFNLNKEAFPESEPPVLESVTLTADCPIFAEYYNVDIQSNKLLADSSIEESSYHTYVNSINLKNDSWESGYIPVLPYMDCQISIYVNNRIFTLRNTPEGGFIPGKVYTLSPESDDFLISANLDQSEFNVGFEQGSINATLITNSDSEVEIEISENAKDWIRISKTRTDYNHSYTLTYQKNTTPAAREGHVIFSVMHSHEFMGKSILASDTLKIFQAPLQGKKTIHVHMSGQLKNLLPEEEMKNITDLTITGIIDHTEDIGYLNTFKNLTRLDLSNVYIVAHTDQLTNFYSTLPDEALYQSASSSTLRTLILPKTLTHLGDKALGFYNLDSLVFHNDIKEIGAYNNLGKKTFIPNENLGYVDKFNSNVEELYITDLRAYCNTSFGVENFYDSHSGGGFRPERIYLDNELITDLVIPAYIQNVNNNAFQNVKSITSVTFADETTYIGHWAFRDCCNLRSIKNYDSLRAIGDGAFANTAITEFHVPEDISELNGDLFNNCTSLSKITFNDKLNTIGCMVFYNCTSLQTIELPSSVTIIEAGAFRNCTNLKSTGKLDNVKYLYQYAFMNCSSLESVSFRDLEDMGAGAFSGCENLKKVYVNNFRKWCHMNWCHLITSSYNSWWQIWDYDWNKTTPLYYADELYINNVLTTDLVVPDDVESIGNRAFCGFESLTSVDLNNVSYIGTSFNGCTNLKEVKTSRMEPASVPMYDAFDYSIRSTCTLKVPSGSSEAYRNSSWGNYFTDIQEY